MPPIAPCFFFCASGVSPTPLNVFGIGGATHPTNHAQVLPILRRLDASILAMVAALFLTFVSAEVITALGLGLANPNPNPNPSPNPNPNQAITAFEGENGPTTLKTIYGDEVTARLRVGVRGWA